MASAEIVNRQANPLQTQPQQHVQSGGLVLHHPAFGDFQSQLAGGNAGLVELCLHHGDEAG